MSDRLVRTGIAEGGCGKRAGLGALALTSGFLTSAGCGVESAPSGAAAVDSAGVTIVTNAASGLEAAERWSLSETPSVDIGSGVDPPVSLFRVVDALPIDRDRVVIGMTSPPQVLVVGADGTLASRLGRQGDGPGEFMGVATVVSLGSDSLAVWDPERRRISIFSDAGTLRREVDLREIAPLSWIASPNVLAPSARTYLLPSTAGSLVLFSVGMFGPGAGVRRVLAPSTRIDAEGRPLASLGSFPGETTFMSEATGAAPFPLGADTYGTTVADDLVVGTSEDPEYRVYGPGGSLERIVRWPDHDRAVAGPLLSEWSEFLEGFLSSMPQTERQGVRDILDAMPQPDRFPAYGGLIGSDTGEVWIGPYHPGHLLLGVAYMGRPAVPEQEWLVFGPAGSLEAKVTTPSGFRPLTVAGARLWGVFVDELEVESVRAYDVLRF